MKQKRETKSETIAIRMTPSLRAKLEHEAQRRMATLSALVNKLVSDGIHTLRKEQF